MAESRLRALLSTVWLALPKRVRRLSVLAVEQRFTVTVAAVVRDDQDRVLLLKHAFRAGTGWGIPGGFIARGEQPEEALRRELDEEIGLEVDCVELAFVRTLSIVDQVEIVFRCRASNSPAPRGIEIERAVWVAPDALPPDLGRDQVRLVQRALGSAPTDLPSGEKEKY